MNGCANAPTPTIPTRIPIARSYLIAPILVGALLAAPASRNEASRSADGRSKQRLYRAVAVVPDLDRPLTVMSACSVYNVCSTLPQPYPLSTPYPSDKETSPRHIATGPSAFQPIQAGAARFVLPNP